jgi:hypothetical protein
LVKANAAARRYSQQQLIIPQQKVEVAQVLKVLFSPEIPFEWMRLGILDPDDCRQVGKDSSTPPLEKRFLARIVAKNSFSSSLTSTTETFDDLVQIQSFALQL